jgi:hypothetical protein
MTVDHAFEVVGLGELGDNLVEGRSFRHLALGMGSGHGPAPSPSRNP